MGSNCCQNPEQSNETSKDTNSTIEQNNGKKGVLKQLKAINSIRQIKMHKSKIDPMFRLVVPTNPDLPYTELDQAHNDIPERSGLESQAYSLRRSVSSFKCQTNFKVEPIHFRVQKDIAVLSDKYIIQGTIGKGSFGEVRKIKDRETKNVRALKIISKENYKETDNFLEEIKIIQSLVILYIT